MANLNFSCLCAQCNNRSITFVIENVYPTSLYLVSTDLAHYASVNDLNFVQRFAAGNIRANEVVATYVRCTHAQTGRNVLLTVTKVILDTLPELSSITLGCDPEFAAYLGSNRVNFASLVGQDGKLGWDHSGEVGELRPPPARFARTLLRRMRNIMQTAPEQLRSATWRSGAIAKRIPEPAEDRNAFSCLGGHVHLGVDFRLCSLAPITKGLDTFTNSLFKLDMLPEKENKIRQRAYGRPGDMRKDYKGGQPVIEYRTMCSWLFDPRVALIALEGARLTTAEPEFAVKKLTTPSHTNLHDFFAAFKKQSKDAAYIAEVILPKLGKLQFDKDVQDAWELDAPKMTQIGY